MPVDFSAKQHEFTQYIRNPQANPAPADVKPERMAMYRELIFNNIDNFLSGNFPVIRQILSDAQWLAMVQDFIIRHRAITPYFAGIAEEFLYYLENERNQPDDPPFLLELAHYEWVEMALSIAMEEVEPVSGEIASLADYQLSLSPLAWPLVYRFPVHLIAPDYVPTSPPETPVCLIVLRNRHDEIKFSEINAMTYRLLELIQEQEWVGTEQILTRMAAESPQIASSVIFKGGQQILRDLIGKDVLRVRPAA